MNRLALFSLVLVGAGCASDGAEGFEILHNLAPTTGTQCTVSPGGAMLPHGIIEQGSPLGYLFTPEMSSRIVVTDNTTVSQRTIALRGAKIEVVDATTDASISKFKALFSGSLPPGGTVSTAFTILPTSLLKGLSVPADGLEVVAKITPFGALGGTGDEIDGVPFFYPITVCNGCVVNVIGVCPSPAGTTSGSPNGCNQFQDGVVNCCTDMMDPNKLICPTTIAMAAR